jgi:hypothetical protein
MISISLALGFALLGPPAPVIAPAETAGEPAIAPAELPAEQAGSQPVVQRPGEGTPPPEHEPKDPGLPIYDSEPGPVEPVEPVEPQPGDDALPTWSEEPIAEPLDDAWYAPEMQPAKLPGEPRRGIGLLVGGSLGFAAMFTRQWITQIVCSDVYCGFRGNLDRVFLLGSIGMIGGGAWMEGRHTGFMRGHWKDPMRPLVGRRAAGWTMFAVGLAGMITEAGLYMACYDAARGPFVELNGLAYTCRPAASVLMMDGSAVLSSVGFGLAMSAQSERREMAKRGKVVMLPYASADRAGVALVGRF